MRRVEALGPAHGNMRICLVYDCLYPHTVGGGEHWYRDLARRLSRDGHEVTYLTMRQWPRETDPDFDGVSVRPVAPAMALYTKGRRRILPPLVFGAGVAWHLLRRGRRYDAVHICAFPYFSLLGAALVRPLHRYQLVVDWFEVWSRDYWREYLGPAGVVGWLVQRACIRIPQRAACFSRLHAQRLHGEGLRGQITLVEGLYGGDPHELPPVEEPEPVVVFAGRHIPEKRVPALVPAVARARRSLPGLTAELYGDGPDRGLVLRRISELGLQDVVAAPGFVEDGAVEQALARALCLVLPSRREGYGMIVVEAAARGTPSIVVSGPDNAATEMVEEGVNGFIVRSASAEDLAEAIVRVHEAGPGLRDATRAWFERHSRRLSLEQSLETVVGRYRVSVSDRS